MRKTQPTDFREMHIKLLIVARLSKYTSMVSRGGQKYRDIARLLVCRGIPIFLSPTRVCSLSDQSVRFWRVGVGRGGWLSKPACEFGMVFINGLQTGLEKYLPHRVMGVNYDTTSKWTSTPLPSPVIVRVSSLYNSIWENENE